ncbi:hypothetical protein HK102_008584 [Quaeritorhiza haematococci]|nr:hypothetical protein HK102_008584 [Quaeritorhiza haematococci]
MASHRQHHLRILIQPPQRPPSFSSFDDNRSDVSSPSPSSQSIESSHDFPIHQQGSKSSAVDTENILPTLGLAGISSSDPPAHQWTAQRVARWLDDNQFGRYRQIFLDNHVTGAVLLELPFGSLKQLGVSTVGERARILVAVKRLRSWARAAASGNNGWTGRSSGMSGSDNVSMLRGAGEVDLPLGANVVTGSDHMADTRVRNGTGSENGSAFVRRIPPRTRSMMSLNDTSTTAKMDANAINGRAAAAVGADYADQLQSVGPLINNKLHQLQRQPRNVRSTESLKPESGQTHGIKNFFTFTRSSSKNAMHDLAAMKGQAFNDFPSDATPPSSTNSSASSSPSHTSSAASSNLPSQANSPLLPNRSQKSLPAFQRDFRLPMDDLPSYPLAAEPYSSEMFPDNDPSSGVASDRWGSDPSFVKSASLPRNTHSQQNWNDNLPERVDSLLDSINTDLPPVYYEPFRGLSAPLEKVDDWTPTWQHYPQGPDSASSDHGLHPTTMARSSSLKRAAAVRGRGAASPVPPIITPRSSSMKNSEMRSGTLERRYAHTPAMAAARSKDSNVNVIYLPGMYPASTGPASASVYSTTQPVNVIPSLPLSAPPTVRPLPYELARGNMDERPPSPRRLFDHRSDKSSQSSPKSTSPTSELFGFRKATKEKSDKKKADEALPSPRTSAPSKPYLPANSNSNFPPERSDIMQVDLVRLRCIRVNGLDKQSHIIDVGDLNSAQMIKAKIYAKFNIRGEDRNRFCLFCLDASGNLDTQNCLDDEALLAICKSPNTTLKGNLVLMKDPSYPDAGIQDDDVDEDDFLDQDSTPKAHRSRSDTVLRKERSFRKLQNFFGEEAPPATIPKPLSKKSSQGSLDGTRQISEKEGIKKTLSVTGAPITSSSPPSMSVLDRPPLAPTHKVNRTNRVPSNDTRLRRSITHAGTGGEESPTLPEVVGEVRRASTQFSPNNRLGILFGERPPSELIADQLDMFFPDIANAEVDSAAAGQEGGEADQRTSLRRIITETIKSKRVSRINTFKSGIGNRVSRRRTIGAMDPAAAFDDESTAVGDGVSSSAGEEEWKKPEAHEDGEDPSKKVKNNALSSINENTNSKTVTQEWRERLSSMGFEAVEPDDPSTSSATALSQTRSRKKSQSGRQKGSQGSVKRGKSRKVRSPSAPASVGQLGSSSGDDEHTVARPISSVENGAFENGDAGGFADAEVNRVSDTLFIKSGKSLHVPKPDDGIVKDVNAKFAGAVSTEFDASSKSEEMSGSLEDDVMGNTEVELPPIPPKRTLSLMIGRKLKPSGDSILTDGTGTSTSSSTTIRIITSMPEHSVPDSASAYSAHSVGKDSEASDDQSIAELKTPTNIIPVVQILPASPVASAGGNDVAAEIPYSGGPSKDALGAELMDDGEEMEDEEEDEESGSDEDDAIVPDELQQIESPREPPKIQIPSPSDTTDSDSTPVSAGPDGWVSPEAPTKINWIRSYLIGRGSFGRVYLALNVSTGEFMAVKQVEMMVPRAGGGRAEFVGGGARAMRMTAEEKQKNLYRKMVDALHREITLLKDLDHVNIVRYLGFDVEDTTVSLFMEYVSGGSIATLIAKIGLFEECLVRSMVWQILCGLCYLHERCIIHRDIKGANILVDEDGVAKISDFGISKKNDYPMPYRINSRMSLQGSVYWMAPEVIKDRGYSAKVDIWSLGCLVLEMLTGSHPWKQLDEMQTMWKLGRDSAPPIPDYLSAEAKDFVTQCFLIDPDKRPTAGQLLDHPFADVDPAFDFKTYYAAAMERKEASRSRSRSYSDDTSSTLDTSYTGSSASDLDTAVTDSTIDEMSIVGTIMQDQEGDEENPGDRTPTEAITFPTLRKVEKGEGSAVSTGTSSLNESTV